MYAGRFTNDARRHTKEGAIYNTHPPGGVAYQNAVMIKRQEIKVLMLEWLDPCSITMLMVLYFL